MWRHLPNSDQSRWMHDVRYSVAGISDISLHRWSTKRSSRRLRRCFDSSRISLVLECFWHLVGEKVSENQKGKKAKKRKTFPFFLSPLSSFPSFHVFFSFFLSFSLSLSFSLFLSFTISFLYLFFSSLSCWAKKITKIIEIIENTQKYQNHQKSPKSPQIPKNPIREGVPKITSAKITKHYQNRGQKKPWNATRQVKIPF